MFKGEKKFNIIGAFLNISVFLILISDSYLIPSNQEQHTVSDFRIIHNSGGRVHGGGGIRFKNYILISMTGDEYEVSKSFSEILESGDIFTITKSGLFKRDLKISYQKESNFREENIGKLNTSAIIRFSFFISSIISLLVIIISYNNIKVYKNLHTLVHILALMYSFCNTIIYFT
jgi:hypothetical protein